MFTVQNDRHIATPLRHLFTGPRRFGREPRHIPLKHSANRQHSKGQQTPQTKSFNCDALVCFVRTCPHPPHKLRVTTNVGKGANGKFYPIFHNIIMADILKLSASDIWQILLSEICLLKTSSFGEIVDSQEFDPPKQVLKTHPRILSPYEGILHHAHK